MSVTIVRYQAVLAVNLPQMDFVNLLPGKKVYKTKQECLRAFWLSFLTEYSQIFWNKDFDELRVPGIHDDLVFEHENHLVYSIHNGDYPDKVQELFSSCIDKSNIFNYQKVDLFIEELKKLVLDENDINIFLEEFYGMPSRYTLTINKIEIEIQFE